MPVGREHMDRQTERLDRKHVGLEFLQCKRWRWLGGMRKVRGSRKADLGDDRWFGFEIDMGGDAYDAPDVTDPCTLGGIVALVRETHDDPWAHVRDALQDFANKGDWVCLVSARCYYGDTEAEALLAALQAAP